MPIRTKGFELVLKDYPKDKVDLLLQYHNQNGGLSRYVKFRYFFEVILGRNVSNEEVNLWASKFSEIMLENLCDSNLLIMDSINFINANHKKIKMHIVSGSDEIELQKICSVLKLTHKFLSINGSPTPKVKIVENLIRRYSYDKNEIALIGDSHNDLEASVDNEISFYGYNNESLINENYITRFDILT
jgi:phosphoglycolate phosphatase-like HAD superfamily hydrolase